MNLLKETTEALKTRGKSWDDVKWVGCYDFKMTPEDVREYFDVDYAPEYGKQKVAEDLMVVGKDFYLARGKYAEFELWEFHTMPSEPTETKRVCGVASSRSWSSLDDYIYAAIG